MQKSVITVVGKDTIGIIAKVCSFLAAENINNSRIESHPLSS